jgi:hypothetical protein
MLALALCACAGTQPAPAPQAAYPTLVGHCRRCPPTELGRATSAEVELTKQGFETFAVSAGAVVNGTGLDLVTGVPSILEWALPLLVDRQCPAGVQHGRGH